MFSSRRQSAIPGFRLQNYGFKNNPKVTIAKLSQLEQIYGTEDWAIKANQRLECLVKRAYKQTGFLQPYVPGRF